MIKKDWGVQTDDGREGVMNPNSNTSWHLHSKKTRIHATGILYVVSLDESDDLVVRVVPAGGLSIEADTLHCLFTCQMEAIFKESGTDIRNDIDRMPTVPEWLHAVINGVRGMYSCRLLPTERRGDQAVSQITNDADVTTSK